jgi:hypothetical protein
VCLNVRTVMGLYMILNVCTLWFIREMYEMPHGKNHLRDQDICGK